MSVNKRVLFPFVGDTYGGSHISALTLVEMLNNVSGIDAVVGLHEYFYRVSHELRIERCLSTKVSPRAVSGHVSQVILASNSGDSVTPLSGGRVPQG